MSDEEEISEVFFDLANTPSISYRCHSGSQDSNDGDVNVNGRCCLHFTATEGAGIVKKGKKVTAPASSDIKSSHEYHRHGIELVIVQNADSKSGSVQHTGKVVWETAYILSSFFEHVAWNLREESFRCKRRTRSNVNLGHHGGNRKKCRGSKSSSEKNVSSYLGNVLEVGAGCGLLGLVLAYSGPSSALKNHPDDVNPAKLVNGVKKNAENLWDKMADSVILTEAAEVIKNLTKNVQFNADRVKRIREYLEEDNKKRTEAGDDSSNKKRERENRVAVQSKILRWDKYIEDLPDVLASLSPDEGGETDSENRFDTIVGTDVIFSPDLVRPLLETLSAASDRTTTVYLCVQERCEESHALFLKLTPGYFTELDDMSDELKRTPGFCGEAAVDMDCVLLRLRGVIPKA